MSHAPSRPAAMFAQLREARRHIAAADDAQILRVLRMVETMENRGEADALVAAVRPRLSRLRPPRKLRFSRLLFMPADLLIVDHQDWNPAYPLIPRTALLPLASLMRAALGHLAAEIDEIIADRDNADEPAIAAAGGILWPKAAAFFESAQIPAGWAASGLPATSFVPITRGLAAILIAAPGFAATGDGNASLVDLTRDTMTNPPGFAMVLTSLLLRYSADSSPREVLAIARKSDDAVQHAARQAIDAALYMLALHDRTDWPIIPACAGQLKHDIALLELLESDPASARRGAALRQQLHQHCAARFTASMEKTVCAPLAQFSQRGEATDCLLGELEQSARALRAFECEARRLGNASIYDRSLLASADSARQNQTLSQVERARLVEILCGPSAGLALLNGG